MKTKQNLLRASMENFLSFEEKDSLDIELIKWKKSYERMSLQDKPKSATAALSKCSPQNFPALHKIFTIFLTTPVGSVSCERSFSALHHLKLWTRSSMTGEHLSGLAMMLIHRGTEYIPSPEQIYSRKSSWRQFRN